MYATVDDMIARVGLDALEDLARGEVDPERTSDSYNRVTEALRAATNLIDSYVQTRYPVPLNPVPEVIRDQAIHIALYQLASWRGIDMDGQGAILATNYRAAERWLEQVAMGKVTLGSAPAPPAPGGVEFNSQRRVFSRDRLKGW